MATNGGTLHQGLPPTPRTNLSCSQCGVLLDSVESLNVHNMHYHSDQINRWSAQTSGPNKSTSIASNSPTDSENNNQPKHNIHNIQNSSKSGSPLNNTISAAADSSDNHSSTTQQSSTIETMQPRISYGGYGMSNAPSSFPHQQSAPEMNYQAYHGYDPYYPSTMDYAFGHSQLLSSQPPPRQEYKQVPSTRFHPYQMANSTLPNAINHSVSPRNVSSSSPIQNSSVMQSSTSPSNSMIPTSQPTPSPSPNQCDKCGQICETACQLNDHYVSAHGSAGHNDSNRPVGSNEETEISSFSYAHYIKEEQGDILDLDSHKMVYPPTEEPNQQGPLPPMHSLHRSIIWTHDPHTFVPTHPQDLKSVLFSANLPAKQEFPTSVIKSEYGHHQPQIGHQQQPDVKGFNNDVNTNQMTTSPSEFPSTTTPQDGGPQFRPSFEAATSSLPTSAPTKSSSWKSNEARRPKTYNCTACNKWFTSSGHLKRHYNTTLHKNAVKSSGQPDPASVPISHHHHPSRDQNKNNSSHRGSPGQGLSAPPPPEQSRSPEYSPQYLPPMGFQQPQGFQHFGTALGMHSTTGSSPNGQAGPSALASQPRGLLISLNNTGTRQALPHQEQIFTPATIQSHINNSLEQYNTINRTNHTNTNITTVSYQQDIPVAELLHPNYHITIGNGGHDDDMIPQTNVNYNSINHTRILKSSPSHNTLYPANQRLLGGVAAFHGEMTPPFSPDMPDTYHTMNQQNPMTPPSAATQPPSPPVEYSSPIISSTENSIEMDSSIRCIECVKVFNRACYLTQHNKTFHSGEKPFKCSICGKRFPSGETLEHHQEKHNAIKPFKCDKEKCEKSFNHKTDLRRHMCLHTGVKPHQCDQCSKGFIRKDHMVKHRQTHTRKLAVMAKKKLELGHK